MHKRCINHSLHLILVKKVSARAANVICTHLLDANVTCFCFGSLLIYLFNRLFIYDFSACTCMQLFTYL